MSTSEAKLVAVLEVVLCEKGRDLNTTSSSVLNECIWLYNIHLFILIFIILIHAFLYYIILLLFIQYLIVPKLL